MKSHFAIRVVSLAVCAVCAACAVCAVCAVAAAVAAGPVFAQSASPAQALLNQSLVVNLGAFVM